MPQEHKAVYAWNPDRFLSWAQKTGHFTQKLIKNMLESREFPVQSYRACMGIMRLCKNYSTEIMEAASKEALERNTCSFKYFNILLKQIAASGSTERSEKIIRNENVRVRSAYVGGGIRA